eukprot:UN07646
MGRDCSTCFFDDDGNEEFTQDQSQLTFAMSAITRTVAQRVVHPQYSPGDEFNDIALLKLNSPLPCDKP